MASVVPHCSCTPASEKHAVCFRTSLSSCFSRRHSFSSSESALSGAAVSVYELKFQNIVHAARAEATMALETGTPISGAGTLVDATKVVSLAREAVLAANQLFMLSSMHDYKSEFISEEDLLRLQRARLAALEMNLFEFNESESFQITHDQEDTSSSVYVNDLCHQQTNFEDQNYTRNGESVAVRSARRKERLTKRERAQKKSVSMPTITEDTFKSTRRHSKVPGPGTMPDPIRSFLVTNGSKKSKLLTAAEEVNLSHKIQDLLVLESVKKAVHKQLGREPTLSEWANAMNMKLAAFSTRLMEGQRCKDRMIKCNLRLVISVAKKYEGKGLSLEDLMQEGSQGLIRGCEKFDPNKGFKFSTYAHWWIMQAVTKALLQKSRLVRLPANLFDTILCVRRSKQVLQLKYGCSPSDAVVARHAGVTMERMRTVSKASKFCKSLDKLVGKESNMNLQDMIPDASIHPAECKFMKRLVKEDVDSVLQTLKPKERDVMRLRYGLDDGKRRTLEEIGRMYNVTRERIRQIECKAMIKLKDPERNEALRGLLYEL